MQVGTKVTIEAGSGLSAFRTGQSGVIIAIVGCFAFVVLDVDGEIKGCLITGLQPKVTRDTFA